jgi:signal transduction histidine kinase
MGEPPSWRQRLQARAGTVLTVLGGLAVLALLLIGPIVWVSNYMSLLQSEYNTQHWSDLESVEQNWRSLPYLRPFLSGDEPEVKAFIDRQPLVVAVLDRWEGRRLWTREEDRLVVADEQQPCTRLYRDWIAQAESAQRFEWNPPGPRDPDFGKISTVVLLADRWIVIKRWEPGNPRVERMLNATLGSQSKVRVALSHESQDAAVASGQIPVQAWGAEPNLQVDPGRLNALILLSAKSSTFGEGWSLVAIPPRSEQRVLNQRIRHQLYLAALASMLVGCSVVIGLWLRKRSRQKAILNADRLASLTHSLKTPLAILKFRCDSLRLGRLPAEQADEELLKLGEEVNHLTLMIENGLRAIRGDATSGPVSLVDEVWLHSVIEDLRPGFEAEQRPLELRFGPARGKASLPSLRAAILTLVENALYHGGGKVIVETLVYKQQLIIRVRDEGEGLDSVQLDVIGKPFQRIRERGQEGFLREGQGLGLSLLAQVAEREGWGLAFESTLGEGFMAQLEIQAV